VAWRKGGENRFLPCRRRVKAGVLGYCCRPSNMTPACSSDKDFYSDSFVISSNGITATWTLPVVIAHVVTCIRLRRLLHTCSCTIDNAARESSFRTWERFSAWRRCTRCVENNSHSFMQVHESMSLADFTKMFRIELTQKNTPLCNVSKTANTLC